MKPRPDEAQSTKFSYYENSLLISPTTFEIFKFENRPPPVGAKTKMDFHVSLGFLGLGQGGSEKPVSKIFYRAPCQIYGLEVPVGQHPPGPTRNHFRGNFI